MDKANILNEDLKKIQMQQIKTSFVASLCLAIVLSYFEAFLFYKNTKHIHSAFTQKLRAIRRRLYEQTESYQNDERYSQLLHIANENFLILNSEKDGIHASDKNIAKKGYDTAFHLFVLSLVIVTCILSAQWRREINWKMVSFFVVGSSLAIIPFQMHFTENVIKKTKTMSDEEVLQFIQTHCKKKA